MTNLAMAFLLGFTWIFRAASLRNRFLSTRLRGAWTGVSPGCGGDHFLQRAPQDLAVGIAGNPLDLDRSNVAVGEAREGPREAPAELGVVAVRSGERDMNLLDSLRVGQTADADVRTLQVPRDRCLNVAGSNLLAANIQELVAASHHVQLPTALQHTHVARIEPAIPEHALCRLGIIEIPGRHRVDFESDPAGSARRQRHAVIVHDLD